jgi:hypothetical protein
MPEFAIGEHLSQMTPDEPLTGVLDTRDYTLADYTFEIIKDHVRAFEETVDNDHEVAMQLAAFGHSVLMYVEEISYANPSTLIFKGNVGGQRTTLIQHVTQLNFLLTVAEKKDPASAPRKIGFRVPTGDQTD